MTTGSCPYCGSEVPLELVLPPMSNRQLRLYRAVASAGYDGIAPEDLLISMYAEGKERTPGGGIVMRVQIHEINKKLEPHNQRIVGKRYGAYRLVSVNGAINGSSAKEKKAARNRAHHHEDQDQK